VESKFVTTPKLEILCSHSFLPHLNEPMEMAMLPAPADEQQASRIVGLTRSSAPEETEGSTRERRSEDAVRTTELCFCFGSLM